MAQQIAVWGSTRSAVAGGPRKITYEDFLAADLENRNVEWVDGEIVPLPTPSADHLDLGSFLGALLRIFVDAHSLGTLFGAPFQMKTGATLPGRQPDILFVAKHHRGRFKTNYLAGPADLAVEIISPDDPNRDYVDKFREYQTGGVREYWILDPLIRKAFFYDLGADGEYILIPVGEDGIFQSRVLTGLWFDVNWLWQVPLPSVLDVVRGWGLV